jgi:hypothetical protein
MVPGADAVRTGGLALPTKWRSDLPFSVDGSMPIYEPDSSVSRPEMRPAKSSGFTTQKTVLSLSSGSASRVVSTVTITWEKSGDTASDFTVPIVTSLNLSCDCPACRPPADSKAIVIVGPRLEKVSQASQAPISAVTSGTIQTSGMRRA